MDFIRQGFTWLLLPLLLAVGCQTSQTPDPFGRGMSSPLARLSQQTSNVRDNQSAKRGARGTGDPFLSPARDGDVNQLGRAMVSDSQLDDMQARDAAYIAGQPAEPAGQELRPADDWDVEAAAVEGADNRLLHSQRSADTLNESAAHRRLRQLELELQLTDDHAKQDQLALEIARLRKQLSRGAR